MSDAELWLDESVEPLDLEEASEFSERDVDQTTVDGADRPRSLNLIARLARA